MIVLFASMVKNEIDIRIARNIRRLRLERGFSRAELEEGAKLSYGILAQIETLHKVAGKSIQRRVARYLKVPLEEFYTPQAKAEQVAEAAGGYLPGRKAYTRKEREYVNKLLTIFRTKDNRTIRATALVIDAFLKAPDGM